MSSKVDHIAVLPGYSKSDQESLYVFKSCFANDKYSEPQYDYNNLEELIQKETGAKFTPIDPGTMYNYCVSWIAYPYGIPDDHQPCPYNRNFGSHISMSESSESIITVSDSSKEQIHQNTDNTCNLSNRSTKTVAVVTEDTIQVNPDIPAFVIEDTVQLDNSEEQINFGWTGEMN